MIAGSLSICGAWTGTTIPATPENPKGFFEHVCLRERILKPLLDNLGNERLGVRSLPPINHMTYFPKLAEAISLILHSDGYTHDRPWLYKDPKLTLLWPVFRQALPNARWVVTWRDADDVIDSCTRASFFQKHRLNREFRAAFIGAYQQRLDALKCSSDRYWEISTVEVITGNFSALEHLVADLGLTYRPAELAEFISPEHWHGRA